MEANRLSRLWVVSVAVFFISGAAVCAAPADDALNALHRYYEACRNEEISAYMELMDFSDGEDVTENHIENARDLALAVWEAYDILRQDISSIEVSVDEEEGYALISYHIHQELQGDDSEGSAAIATMDMDYVALMHHMERWRVVYLMPRATFEESMQNLSAVIAVADAIEGLAAEQEPGNLPPTASFAFMPQDPEAGDTVVIASTSFDPDGDLLTTSWYLNGEKLLEVDNQSDWEWADVKAGEYTLTLIVEDGKGGINENSTIVKVRATGQESTNRPPTASFSIMPQNPTPDDTIVGVSTSSDPDGDALTYSWYFNGEYASDIGNLPEWTWPNPAEGEYTIGLVVLDIEGGISEVSKTVTVVGETRLVNRPPNASFALMPKNPEAGDTIVIVSTSSDPDGDALSTSWYLNGKRVLDLDSQLNWEWEDVEAGKYILALEIDDGRGGSDGLSMAVTVAGDVEDAWSGSNSKSNLLYLLLIPVAAVAVFLVSRRLRKK